MTGAPVLPDHPVSRPVGDRQIGMPGGDRLRVLLVEDDTEDAFLVSELLAEVDTPIQLSVATTLAEARPRIATVDCVLLDLGLPDAQGLDGLRELLGMAGTAAVCVLTGLEDEHLGAAAVAEGAQDYLIKGKVDGVLLARSLRYAVERKRADENARRLREAEYRQEEASRLERGLLPQPLMTTRAATLNMFYQPGRHSSLLGGDFYDVVQTEPDRIHLMVGDVCGHGVEEAALGAELRVAWRALMLAGVPEDAVLTALERVLVSERRREEIFATVAIATVDLARAEVTIRLAGHPPPLLLAAADVTVLPATFGAVLGVFPDAHRVSSRFALPAAGWTLLLYTDGLIEGRTGVGDERLEVGGLCRLLDGPEARRQLPGRLPNWLIERVEAAHGSPLADDVAMLLLSRNGSTE